VQLSQSTVRLPTDQGRKSNGKTAT